MISRRGLFGLFAGATAVAVAPVGVEIPEYEWVNSGADFHFRGMEIYCDPIRQTRIIGIDRSPKSFWNATKSKEYSDDRI